MNAESLLYVGYVALCRDAGCVAENDSSILAFWEMEWAPGEAADWLRKIATGDYWLDISMGREGKFHIALGGY